MYNRFFKLYMYHSITNFFNNHKVVSMILLFLVLLSIFSFLAFRFRKKVYALMADAEVGELTYKNLYKVVDKIQRSDLDERMVLVIAHIISNMPLLKLLPTKFVVRVLNRIVQNMFDSVKLFLDARANNFASRISNDIDIEKRKRLDEIEEALDVLRNELIDAMSNNTKATKPSSLIESAKVLEVIDEKIEKAKEITTPVTEIANNITSLFNRED